MTAYLDTIEVVPSATPTLVMMELARINFGDP
jgi:hypothetical protein